jgi:selenocysteine-specific elongation factor
MKSVIIGTAGHIDHGKTALVRALTGVDTDRLVEEKRRGITIELGFAHLDLDGPEGPIRFGFVDVPGHERFVHTMLAGVGGIDMVLFVVSAQESVKPQTREHFAICRLLQVRRGIIVLTKCDLVDDVTLQVVRMEVEDMVRGSFLDLGQTPVVPVSAKTGEGIAALTAAMVRMAGQTRQKDVNAPFRLPIDRVFTLKGFGTIVTGTLVSGTVAKEQDVDLLPLGRRVRVRSVQVHGAAVPAAVAGQRTALNLVGVAHDEIERGMSLTQPDLLIPSPRLDVLLTLLPDAADLKNRARVHLHLFSDEVVAQVYLYDRTLLTAGESCWAQLRPVTPIAAAPGDRVVIRQFSPVVTIGGGVVVDTQPLRRMKVAARLAFLDALQNCDDARRLLLLAGRRDRQGLSVSQAIHETGWTKRRLFSAVEAAIRSKDLLRFEDLVVTAADLERIARDLFNAVKAFQTANPLSGGANRQELLTRSGLARDLFAGALGRLVQEGHLAQSGEQVHVPGHRVVMQAEEAQSKAQIEVAFAQAGIRVPSLREVLAELKIDAQRAQKIVTLLLREKVLVKVSDDLVFHRATLQQLKQQVQALAAQSPHMDVARFKEVFDLSRKYAIPLLEYLDREQVTRRVGDERIIL